MTVILARLLWQAPRPSWSKLPRGGVTDGDRKRQGQLQIHPRCWTLFLRLIAQPGFEIVHAAIRPLFASDQGYSIVERHLNGLIARSMRSAVCTCEFPTAFAQGLRRVQSAVYRAAPFVGSGNRRYESGDAYQCGARSERDRRSDAGGLLLHRSFRARTTTFVLSGVPEMRTGDGGVNSSHAAISPRTECARRPNA